MLEMGQVLECKQLSAKGMGFREIARTLGLSRNTVRAYLRDGRRPGRYRLSQPRSQPVRDAIRDRVRELLVAEAAVATPRKQRLTAARIRRILRDEERFASGSVVRQVVRELRLELRDPLEHAYLPLEYDPGVDAQVDFFEALVRGTDGTSRKVFALLVRACFSGRTYMYIAPNQTREALFEGLMRAFEFFGGVFPVLWFDNLTAAVKKVLTGRTRELQRAFTAFQAHYGFRAEFCRPGKGNEKGGVEGAVDFSRHEVFSPMPVADDRDQIQVLADHWMERESDRTIRGRDVTIGEAWALEVPHLIDLPADRFDPSQVRTTKVTPRSWIPYGTNFYSAPVEWVGHVVDLRVSAEWIEIRHPRGQSIRHRRLYGHHQMSLTLEHYLPLLARKCRGLDRAAPMRRWLGGADPAWKTLLGALRARDGEVAGSRDFVEVLRLCGSWGVDTVTEAVHRALGRPEVSLDTVRYHLWHREEAERPAVGSLDVPGPEVQQGCAADYMALCAGAAS